MSFVNGGWPRRHTDRTTTIVGGPGAQMRGTRGNQHLWENSPYFLRHPGHPPLSYRRSQKRDLGYPGTRIPSSVCHLLLMEYKHFAADLISVWFCADLTCWLPLQLLLDPV
jgi:hypothetical protein